MSDPDDVYQAYLDEHDRVIKLEEALQETAGFLNGSGAPQWLRDKVRGLLEETPGTEGNR